MTPWPSPFLPLHLPPPPSPCSCVHAAAAPVAAHRPHLPRCACAAAHRCAARVVGWLYHEARPAHYSLALHREGGDDQRLQQALVMAPQRGVIHSGFTFLRVVGNTFLPSGCGSVGPCMWACMNQRERHKGCVVSKEGGRSSLRDQPGRGDLHGPASGVSRCYGRWTRERPCRRCARTADHSATYGGLDLPATLPVSSGLRLHASIG
jgi:hypothetical protein